MESLTRSSDNGKENNKIRARRFRTGNYYILVFSQSWRLCYSRCKMERELVALYSKNISLRYSEEGDLVLDQFTEDGTTLVEARLLNCDIISVDVNDVALDRCRIKIDFEHKGANSKVYIRKGKALGFYLER